jgi:tetratricopeptide (TPR) repeat protein
MKKIFIFLLWMLIQSTAFGQCSKLDSLYRILRIVKSDTDKINALNHLVGELVAFGKEGQASFYAKQAFEMSQKIEYRKGIADALTHIGLLDYSDLSAYKGTIEDYQQALRIYQDLGDKSNMIKTLEIIGTFYYKSFEKESRRQAIEYYEQVLDIRKELRDTMKLAETYNMLGELYATVENDEKALECFEKAASLHDKLGILNINNDRLLSKYQSIHRIEQNIERSHTRALVIGFSVALGILLMIAIISWVQKNRVSKILKNKGWQG